MMIDCIFGGDDMIRLIARLQQFLRHLSILDENLFGKLNSYFQVVPLIFIYGVVLERRQATQMYRGRRQNL